VTARVSHATWFSRPDREQSDAVLATVKA
jgi:hypothetical protein